mgnify:FL=1
MSLMFEENKFLNSKTCCLICSKKFTNDDPSIKHHIRYKPELIAYVHYTCHNKIHDPDNPLTTFIQYTRQEAIDYYDNKKLLEVTSDKPNNNVILK